MCPERPESFVCFLQDFLGDRDVNQRRVDIAVTQICREEWKFLLRIDTGAVPLENAVHHERMSQVVDARASLASRRLNSGTPQDVDEAPCDAVRRVARVALIVPEQAGFGALWHLRLASHLQIFPQRRQRTVSQWQDPRFEELRLPDGNRANLQIDIGKVQACEFS